MNNSTVRTSRPASAGELAELSFEDDEDTTPSTPYVPKGCALMSRLRASEQPLFQMLVRWYDAVARWLRGR